MANRALHLPGRILGWIGLDTRRSRGILPSAGIRDRQRFAAVIRLLRDTPPSNVSISLEDLLCRDFRIFFEEIGVAKYRLEIFGDL